jgi:gamma-glutamylaminecyclotransferase
MRIFLDRGMSEAPLTFVYGTLQAGEHNHHQLGASRFIRAARTCARFELVDLGPYPALIEGGATAVTGELYEVSAESFAALDAFEGVPELFRRVMIELEDGTRAYAYLFAGGALESAPRIKGGCWRTRGASK